MNRNLYTLLLAICLCIAYNRNASAQCGTGRYVNKIFSYTMDSVTYSSPFNLKMDIYQPVGDTMSARPLVLLAHGGSFIAGDREDDSTVVRLCQNLAERGYVTASIDYRLGNIISMVLDSSYAVDVVIKAISDGKAAMRFFTKDRATTNTYKIDTNNIFIGGNSAGAVLYMHAGYLTNISECPADVVTAMSANGGFDGNSGNAGYTARSRGVINLAGALNTPSFVNAGDLPSVNAQGDIDNTVPYTCAYPLSGSVAVTLCGLGRLEPVYVAKSIYHMSHVFPGDAHVPWDSDPAKFFTVDSLVKEFLYSLVCTSPAGVNVVNTHAEVLLYPNPATEVANIKSAERIASITVCDQTGRVVAEATVNNEHYELNTTKFTSGLYLVRIKFDNENTSPVTKRLVIE